MRRLSISTISTHFSQSADRSSLASIVKENSVSVGEGKYVEYAGFVLHAQYSDRSKSEAVNCNISGTDTNDIHIQMVAQLDDDDACDSNSLNESTSPPRSWTPGKLEGHLVAARGPLLRR